MMLASLCEHCTPLQQIGVNIGLVLAILIVSALVATAVLGLPPRYRLKKWRRNARRLNEQMNERARRDEVGGR